MIKSWSFVSLTFLLAASKLVSAEKCSLCAGEIAFPENVIPGLKIPGPGSTITCLVASDYASILDDTDAMCETLVQQAAYCGCPGVPIPTDECTLCADGTLPQKLERRTIDGDSCEDLNNYLSFLTKDQCENSHAKQLLNSAFGCGCQGATAPCPMCADGSIDINNPDLVVPFLSLSNGHNEPTCQELAFLGSTTDDSKICAMVKAQAAYCGCPGAGVEAPNVCSLCSGGEVPANGNLVIETTGDSCQDIHDYMMFLDESECKSERASDMKALGFVCGCNGAKPKCTLCPDGSESYDREFRIESDGPTCEELAQSVAGLPEEACEEQRKTTIGISAARCGCKDVDFPACSIQQNTNLCTKELLMNATDECECYSFCDGQFFGCNDYPGGLLGREQCPGTPVAGCNHATASNSFDQKRISYALKVTGFVWLVIGLFDL